VMFDFQEMSSNVVQQCAQKLWPRLAMLG